MRSAGHSEEAATFSAAPRGTTRRFGTWLADREVHGYPSSARRYLYLAVVVIASIVLWYQYFVPSVVVTALITHFHISFRFYMNIIIASEFAGVLAALIGQVADRIGRTWFVIGGLGVVGVIQAFVIPNVTGPWELAVAITAVAGCEGVMLVASAALVRDFTAQLGRATAMGFWTVGPTAGVLTASLVASHTLGATSGDWQREFIASGVVGLAVFALSVLFLRELSPQIRDQVMVTRRDVELVELKARGLDVDSATRSPWRQMARADVVVPAVALSVLLVLFYTASGFFVAYWQTVFHTARGFFTLPQANGIDTWIWGVTCGSLILFGVLSDLLRVRKPFMIVGALGMLVFMLLLISHTGHANSSYYTMVWVGSGVFFFLGMVFSTWMASFTETVEERNPALTATGLSIWGGLMRFSAAISFIIAPFVLTSINDVVNNSPYQRYVPHALAIEQRYGPLIAVIQHHQKDFTAATSLTETQLLTQHQALYERLLHDVNGNAGTLLRINAIKPQLEFLQKYQGHLLALQKAAAASPAQWQHWLWVTFGCVVFFIPFVFVMKGRWSPRRAREDGRKHEEYVARELERIHEGTSTIATS
jgi:MFS family permease